MELFGKIITALPERSGTSARGTKWRSITYVLETQEQYPKKLAFDVVNDRIDILNIQVGEVLTVQFDINAREYNGKYYNSINAWNVVRQQHTQGGVPPQQPMQQQPQGQQWGGSQAGAAAASAANRATNFPPPPPTGASAAPAGAAPNPDADDLPF